MNIKNMTVISDEICESIIFHDESIILTDIDSLFSIANKKFAMLLIDLGLDVTFDFKSAFNKKLYTHSFLQTTCDYIYLHSLTPSNSFKVGFYSNLLTKDQFKILLLRKLQRVFGFQILDGILDFSTLVFKLESNSSEWTPKIDMFLTRDTKPKTFKHIKSYLHKTGLTHLDDVYFQDLANRMTIIGG